MKETALQQEGCALAEQQDLQGALRCFEVAAAADPRNAVLHELRAQCLLGLDRYPLALQAARAATQLSPSVSTAQPLVIKHHPH